VKNYITKCSPELLSGEAYCPATRNPASTAVNSFLQTQKSVPSAEKLIRSKRDARNVDPPFKLAGSDAATAAFHFQSAARNVENPLSSAIIVKTAVHSWSWNAKSVTLSNRQ